MNFSTNILLQTLLTEGEIMEKHCDMCWFYDSDECYCSIWHEEHLPSDGDGCTTWEDYADHLGEELPVFM